MASDIFIKTATNTWSLMKNMYIKTTSTTWSAAKSVWMYMGAGWTRVWPLSGIFADTDPYITTSSTNTVHLTSSNVVQIGTTYWGKNGTWNPNGWTIQSYSYEWIAYDYADTAYNSGYSISTGTYTSPTSLDLSGTTVATNSDRKYLSFKVTANASNSAYNGSAESGHTDGRIYIIRKVPLNISYSLNAGPYYEGSTISFSSSWNITEPYKPEGARSTIKWYSASSLTNIYAGGGRTEITRASGLYSWTIETTDNLSGKYIIAEETTFNSGSDYLYGVNGFVNGANQVTIATSTAVQTSVTPGAFSIGSATKGFPVVSSQGAYRPVSISWGASTNATSYEYLIESSPDAVTWSTATTPTSPFTPFSYANDSTAATSVGPLSVNYQKYYRISVRAKSASGIYTYASNNPYSVTGTAPGDPTGLSETHTQTSATITFTNGTSGSNTYNGVQYKLGSGGTWSTTTYTSPFTISGLSPATSYTVYLRSINEDGLTSAGNANISVTTSANPQATGQMRRITMPIAFTGSSQTIWVGTNGYVSTTVDPTTNPGTSWPSAGGVVIGPFVADNYHLALYTYADSSNFYVRWQGRGLGEGSQTLDYLMKFYWSSTTVDVYFIQNTSTYTFSGDAIRYPAGTSYSTWANSTSITGMSIPSGMTQNFTTPTASADDGRIAVTATKPLLNLTTNPAYGTSTSASGGWTASISTSPNPTGGTYSYISATAGSATVNSTTGALTASGLSAGGSSTVTVRYSLSGYNPVDITASGTASAAASPKPPNDPTGLTTPSSGTSPNLVFNSSSWTAPATDSTHNAATYYQVYIEAATTSGGPYYAATNTFSYNYYPGSPLTTSTNANTAATAANVYATAIYSGTVTDTTRAYTWVKMWVRAANADGYSNWVSNYG